MSLSKIDSDDISGWNSLNSIASSFEKRGLKRQPSLGADDELVLELADDEFLVIIDADPSADAKSFTSRMNAARHTNLVATDGFESFTFMTRVRSWDQHGRIKYQQLSFERSQFTGSGGDRYTVLDKLNEIEYGQPTTLYELYDTRQVVKDFYNQFEDLRTDLVQHVGGIPDDRGDAKQRYVQVILDRLIFLYFIQKKNLLDFDPDYLDNQHSKVVNEGGDVYAEFYQPLFFDILAEDNQNLDFGNLPYLNGGLFSKNPIEEEFPEAKLGETTEETNDLFGGILEFLGEWNWHVDERLDIVDPKNLSPAILGHIFEQTVNQKEMGAYYTPEEITNFMARQTIHPYLLDQLNDEVGAAYEDIDDIFALSETATQSTESEVAADGGTLTQLGSVDQIQRDHVETLYFDVLKDARVLDPAVGSGAFLLAAQEVLLDIYLSCIEYFEELREAQPWELTGRVENELDIIASGGKNKTLHAKREIILNNLYGVDIDDGAVEICKLRLWLSMVADIENDPDDVEPLPNIDFNIRQGNSLIGFTELVEANESGDTKLSSYGGGIGDSVQEMYQDVIEAVEKHRDASDSTEAANWRNIAESRIRTHSESLDTKILEQFQEAGLDSVTLEDVREYSPFHWVLEFASVYESGGFDLVIGNPPWDVLSADRDDFFSKYDEVFRTRPPTEKDAKQKELLSNEQIEEAWEAYQRDMEIRSGFFNDSPTYDLQKPTINGKSVGNNQNDLSALFLERVFQIAKDGGRVSQIVPGPVITGSTQKDLRLNLLENTEVGSIIGFENQGIFKNVDNRYRFAVIVFKNGGTTDSLNGIFLQRDLTVLRNPTEKMANIPKEVLTRYSSEAAVFPNVRSQREADTLDKILAHPQIGQDIDGSWQIEPYSEIHRSKDSNLLVEDPQEGDYPIYEGKNIHQFCHDSTFADLTEISLWGVDENEGSEKSARSRVREKDVRNLKTDLYYALGGENTSKSQKQFVNDLLEESRGEPLLDEDALLDCTEYRIVLREVARPTDERTSIATVVPKGAMAVHTLHTVRPYYVNATEEDLNEVPLHGVYNRVFSDKELFVAVGLLNSLPFDFLMRTKVDSHIVMYKLLESQMPRLSDGDDWFNYISSRAARLNCYGDAFAEMRDRLGGITPATDTDERQRLQAEIDAAAFHAYGLDRREMKFVLDDFHRVNNPRMMTEEYFDLVFEKYGELAESGPHQ